MRLSSGIISNFPSTFIDFIDFKVFEISDKVCEREILEILKYLLLLHYSYNCNIL